MKSVTIIINIFAELRTQDIYKIFKDAGFKGLPRLDVYRRFSPLFGIVKREVHNQLWVLRACNS